MQPTLNAMQTGAVIAALVGLAVVLFIVVLAIAAAFSNYEEN
jgi:hypothetical protein